MATRVGLVQARGRSRGAQLLTGQHQLHCQELAASISQTRQQHSSARTIITRSRRSISNVDDNNCRRVLPAYLTPAKKRAELFWCNKRSLSIRPISSRPQSSDLQSRKALLSSQAQPSVEDATAESEEVDDDEEQSGRRDPTWEESRFDPATGLFPWEEKRDRVAELSDGDKYEDFVDLRLEEIEKFFPEGLAGGAHGVLERATSRGMPLSLLRREAATEVIESLDAFATSGRDAIESSVKKRSKARREAQKEESETIVTEEQSVDVEGGPEENEMEEDEGEETKGDGLQWGDVEAAAAEATAAVKAMTIAEAGTADTADDDEEDAADSTAAVEGVGTGPIWEEMMALAESKRRPMKSNRAVQIMPGQRSYLLTGKRGTGKSCILNQIVLHARSTGWIVLFVPDGRDLVQRGVYCQPSPALKDLYDLPVQSLKRLKSLRSAHGDQLKDIEIKDAKILARHEGAKTLLDIVDQGIDDEELAGTAHYDVVKELLKTTEAKVLLAVDEYNELFQPSHWHFGDEKLEAPHLTATLPLVPPLRSTITGLAFADSKLASLATPEVSRRTKAADLPMVDAETGGQCLPPPPANGIVVCAMTGRFPPVKQLKKNKEWNSFESVAGRLADAVSVPVEPYSRGELLRVVKRYSRVEEIIPEPMNGMELAKLHTKSDGLAEWVFNTCVSGYYRITVND